MRMLKVQFLSPAPNFAKRNLILNEIWNPMNKRITYEVKDHNMIDKPWFVYIVECSDKRLYTGISNDVAKRVEKHNKGNGCKFTKYRHPVKLLYQEKCGTQSVARKRELKIQRLTRKKKLALSIF